MAHYLLLFILIILHFPMPSALIFGGCLAGASALYYQSSYKGG